MLNSFTALDFETSQGKRHSICQVGLVRYINGKLTDEVNILVQPPDNYYWSNFIDIHGITPKMTANAPTFDKIWHQISHFITGQNVVAHNGFRFDFPCIEQTLGYYNIDPPVFTGHDTYKIYGVKLSSLCQTYKISLNHHDALSDAKACAELFLMHINKQKHN
jgi:DNA polymerase-3 subunit epsilon